MAPHHRRPRGGRIGWVLLSYGLGIRSTLLMVQSRSARTQRARARSGRRTCPILAAQLQRTGSAIKAAGAHVTRRCGHPPPRCAAAHRRYPIHLLAAPNMSDLIVYGDGLRESLRETVFDTRQTLRNAAHAPNLAIVVAIAPLAALGGSPIDRRLR
jgi:hypothetical protein